MSKLPLLEKNAYLSLVIKDNGLWAHLAYTDHNARREYVLSDFTDLHPLRHRLDDDVFTREFWYNYFDNLERVFNWDIVDKGKNSIFTFHQFKDEGDGVSGIRVQIDDNQEFFDKIFSSIRDFSKDISLRVVDDRYMQETLEELIERGEYEDIMYVDMDLMDFSIFRVRKFYDKKEKAGKKFFSRAKISWKNDLSLIDSVKDSRFKAFLGTDLNSKEIFNYWSNFVLNRVLTSEDPNILDILRSYSTIQNHSLFRDNKEKLEGFGVSGKESCLIVSGYIPQVLGKPRTLLTLIDGLELEGSFDCTWDLDMRLLSYGKSYVNATRSMDVILTSKVMYPSFTKIVIPRHKFTTPNKVIFNGKIESLEQKESEILAVSCKFNYIDLPDQDKFVMSGVLKEGFKIPPERGAGIDLVSSKEGKRYESVLIDARPRPIVYGPDSYSNKSKLQNWMK
ncbi:MAG: seg [candidate division WS6 bacterium 36_33]|uniref:Seg n=1 Tax=candidate division WS6 bacterium 36_33 TaxID=1641388 RepID=A0A101H0T4_9BACT|nr:MAG: seg [candidate division WS6 bacterium 36_33]